jgi:hypothetical protein
MEAYMISSGDEAGSLWKKWAAEPALLHLIMTDIGFRFSVVGLITYASFPHFTFTWEQGNLDVSVLSHSEIRYEEPRDPPEYYLDEYQYLAWLDIKTPPSRRCMMMEIVSLA